MAKINLDPMLEFFATSNEVAEWASSWVRQQHLHAILVQRRPFIATPDADWNDIRYLKTALPQFDMVVFGLQPLDPNAQNANAIAEMNPDRLVIHLPRLTPKGLRAAALGSVTNDARALESWRIIKKDVLSRTTAGMWMANPAIPAKRRYPSVRYSSGAAVVERSGVTLLTFGAETPIFVAEPE